MRLVRRSAVCAGVLGTPSMGELILMGLPRVIKRLMVVQAIPLHLSVVWLRVVVSVLAETSGFYT